MIYPREDMKLAIMGHVIQREELDSKESQGTLKVDCSPADAIGDQSGFASLFPERSFGSACSIPKAAIDAVGLARTWQQESFRLNTTPLCFQPDFKVRSTDSQSS